MGWSFYSRDTEEQLTFQHQRRALREGANLEPFKGFVTFTWNRHIRGGVSHAPNLLPVVTMAFTPDYYTDTPERRSLAFNLGGHGIHGKSEFNEVFAVLDRLMEEGLWDRAVERLNAQPDWTIDWTAGGRLPSDPGSTDS